jgi:mannose-6-phosphate isomerase-like protein (cupin superfamily)
MKRFCYPVGAALLLAASPAMAQDAPHIIDITNAEHYLWGGENDGWHLVKRDDLSVIQERMVPGGLEEKHLHQKARQFFQVLKGTLTLDVGGKTFVLKPNQAIEVPAGTAHQAKNLTKEPIDFVVTSIPPSHGDRVVVKD